MRVVLLSGGATNLPVGVASDSRWRTGRWFGSVRTGADKRPYDRFCVPSVVIVEC